MFRDLSHNLSPFFIGGALLLGGPVFTIFLNIHLGPHAADDCGLLTSSLEQQRKKHELKLSPLANSGEPHQQPLKENRTVSWFLCSLFQEGESLASSGRPPGGSREFGNLSYTSLHTQIWQAKWTYRCLVLPLFLAENPSFERAWKVCSSSLTAIQFRRKSCKPLRLKCTPEKGMSLWRLS